MKTKSYLLVLFFLYGIPYGLLADVVSNQDKNEYELLRDHIASNQLTQYFLIACIIIAILAIIYLYNRTKKIRRQHKRISEQKSQLKERERNYQEIFDYSLDSIITTDPNGIITNLNASASTMLGYSYEELLGSDVNVLFASKDQGIKVIKELNESGRFNGEIFNRTKDDKILITRLAANQVLDQNGKVVGTMGISRDITRESTLRDEYNKLINNVSDIIYTTDMLGNFTYVNQPVESILGYSINEIETKSFRDLIHEDDLEMVTKHFEEVFRERLKESYLEFKVRTKENNFVWVGQQVNTKFNKYDNSKIEGYYGIVRVIDERKRAELKLQGSEKKYRDLIDNTTDLVQVIDKNGNIQFVNRAWRKTLKYSKEEVKKLNVFQLIHPESMEHCGALFQTIKEHKQTQTERILYTLVAQDGEKILVEGSFNAKYDKNDEIVSIQSFLRNVTLQKEAERQLAQKESTLRQITETINDVFYLYNIIDKKYEYISPNCELTLGATDQFFYDGKESHTDVFGHPDDKGKLKNAESLVDEGYTYDINYRIIIDGETRWVNEKSFAIRDEKGNVVANSGICRDITEIREANETIRLQNLEIESSMVYAKRIQDAVLPSKPEINRVFPDSFVLFKPKDIVGGDFYIVENIQTLQGGEIPAIIVGDCTGHGVPGAVLSLMCNVLVRESFTRHDVHSPADALEYVRTRLTNFFSHTGQDNIRDGMDIAFCAVDDEKNQVHFCGANSKCILVRDGKLEVFRGNRQHVGYDENPSPFTLHVIDVQEGDRIFLYSDGLPDQFGGENGKKFGKLQLHKLLQNEDNLNMTQLGQLIEAELIDWQGDKEQVDDITLLGVQL